MYAARHGDGFGFAAPTTVNIFRVQFRVSYRTTRPSVLNAACSENWGSPPIVSTSRAYVVYRVAFCGMTCRLAWEERGQGRENVRTLHVLIRTYVREISFVWPKLWCSPEGQGSHQVAACLCFKRRKRTCQKHLLHTSDRSSISYLVI